MGRPETLNNAVNVSMGNIFYLSIVILLIITYQKPIFGFTLSGYIYNPDKNPAENIKIILTNFYDFTRIKHEATTDSNGYYKIENISKKNYKIIINHDDYIPILDELICEYCPNNYERNFYLKNDTIDYDDVSGNYEGSISIISNEPGGGTVDFKAQLTHKGTKIKGTLWGKRPEAKFKGNFRGNIRDGILLFKSTAYRHGCKNLLKGTALIKDYYVFIVNKGNTMIYLQFVFKGRNCDGVTFRGDGSMKQYKD